MNPGETHGGSLSGRTVAGIIMALLLVLPGVAGVGSLVGEEVPETWLQKERITPDDAYEDGISDPDAGNINPFHSFVAFGSSLDIDGDTLVVGTAFDSCDLATWAYVFERSADGSWQQTAKLYPSDASHAGTNYSDPCSGFGHSVAVDDDEGTIVVGNPGYDVPDETDAGAVYVFEEDPDGSWIETARMVGPVNGDDGEVSQPGLSHGPFFGYSVNILGDTIVVGTPDDDRSEDRAGSISIYQREDNGWSTTSVLHGSYREHLGLHATIQEEVIVASATGASPGGAAYIYTVENGTWSKNQTLRPPPPSIGPTDTGFGSDIVVSADASRIFISDIWNDEVAGFNLGAIGEETYNVGAVYVFERSGDGWELTSELSNPDPDEEGARFGTDLAASENLLVVGASHDAPERTGTAYVYERRGEDAWSQPLKLSGSDTSTGDYFGHQVGLSGGQLVVSAPFDDNRRDGTPPVVNDDGDLPQLNHCPPGWQCDAGEDAGTVYVFHPEELLGLSDS